MDRRMFLNTIPAWLISTSGVVNRVAGSEASLHILRGDNLERLRLDFNASRSKIRLLTLLSPT